MDDLLLQRSLGGIYIPPVDVMDDQAAMGEMLETHIQQKDFLMALSTDEYIHEDILEFVETYVGTNNMDKYIQKTEQKLDRVLE